MNTKDRKTFTKVYDWMIHIPLKGSDLLVYACIFSLSNTTDDYLSIFSGCTKDYLSWRFKLSIRTIDRIINRLEAKGLISSVIGKNNKKHYWASEEQGLKIAIQWGYQKSLH